MPLDLDEVYIDIPANIRYDASPHWHLGVNSYHTLGDWDAIDQQKFV